MALTLLLKLPKDILKCIRNYLIMDLRENPFKFDPEPENFIGSYMESESSWSWRNFLAVSCHPEWKHMRRETMIWSFRFESSIYFNDESFRSKINSLLVDIEVQLKSNLSEITYHPIKKLLPMKTSPRHVFISNYLSREFPSSPYLETLILEECECLERIGDYQ
jgi:hypothetical protein